MYHDQARTLRTAKVGVRSYRQSHCRRMPHKSKLAVGKGTVDLVHPNSRSNSLLNPQTIDSALRPVSQHLLACLNNALAWAGKVQRENLKAM